MGDSSASPQSGGDDSGDLITVCRSARLQPMAYQFYRAVLLTFVEQGQPPDPAALRRLAKRFDVPLQATLADMAAQDLVQRDPSSGRIRAAYPFSGVPTAHRVTLFADHEANGAGHLQQADQAEVQVFAMCALDALGIPLMLQRSALITSSDALTGAPVRVNVRRPPGADSPAATIAMAYWQVEWDPAEVVVYARPEGHEVEHDAGRCIAEGTCCPVTNFFSSPAHASEWIARQPAAGSLDGLVLSRTDALARAQALFGGVLDRVEPEPMQTDDSGVDDRPRSRRIQQWATVHCPRCGAHHREHMPINACQVRYTCPTCGAVLAPLSGDCCIFCSYGDWPCPPEQEARHLGQDSPSADD